jgi:hypothetical protein
LASHNLITSPRQKSSSLSLFYGLTLNFFIYSKKGFCETLLQNLRDISAKNELNFQIYDLPSFCEGENLRLRFFKISRASKLKAILFYFIVLFKMRFFTFKLTGKVSIIFCLKSENFAIIAKNFFYVNIFFLSSIGKLISIFSALAFNVEGLCAEHKKCIFFIQNDKALSRRFGVMSPYRITLASQFFSRS